MSEQRREELAKQIAHANGLGVRAEVCGDDAQRAEAKRLYDEAIGELRQLDMARDAARYRWLRDHGLKYSNVGLGSDCDGGNVVDFSPTFTIPEPVGMSYEDNEWSLNDLDAAIDAAIAAATGTPT